MLQMNFNQIIVFTFSNFAARPLDRFTGLERNTRVLRGEVCDAKGRRGDAGLRWASENMDCGGAHREEVPDPVLLLPVRQLAPFVSLFGAWKSINN
jgi:hypothetical protein